MHDCIIIPGFGGFVANQKPSFLNPAHHIFSPPSKRIAFNSSLRIGDGLLANHISKTLNLTYREANEEIEKFVKNSLATLTNGERLVIDKIGTLFYDAEKNIQFVPDTAANYLKASFGLASIHSPAIKRDEDVRRTMNVLKPGADAKRVHQLKSWRMIELIPAAAILIWLMISPPVLRNMNLGNLNPFPKPITLIQSPKVETKESNHSYFEQEKNKSQAVTPSADSAVEQLKEEFATTKTPTEELLATPVPTPVAAQPVAKKEVEAVATKANNIAEPISTEVHKTEINNTVKLSYVVGGCFKEYNNAVNYRDQALADGFQAAIIGLHKGLHVVSLFSSADEKRVATEMALIKDKFQPQAWLLKK